MAVLTFPKGSNVQLSDHFHLSEFECPCSVCDTVLVDSQLITNLEQLRATIGKPLKINSGYRCDNYQTELRLLGYETSVGRSTHQDGRASDCMAEPLTGPELETAARAAGFTSIGVGGTWIHADLRPGYRRWEYTKR